MTRKDEVSETKRPLCERSTLSMRCCLSPCGRVAGHDGDCEPVHEYSCAPTPEPAQERCEHFPPCDNIAECAATLAVDDEPDPCADCYHVHTAGVGTECLVINCGCGAPVTMGERETVTAFIGRESNYGPEEPGVYGKLGRALQGWRATEAENARLTRELAEERAKGEQRRECRCGDHTNGCTVACVPCGEALNAYVRTLPSAPPVDLSAVAAEIANESVRRLFASGAIQVLHNTFADTYRKVIRQATADTLTRALTSTAQQEEGCGGCDTGDCAPASSSAPYTMPGCEVHSNVFNAFVAGVQWRERNTDAASDAVGAAASEYAEPFACPSTPDTPHTTLAAVLANPTSFEAQKRHTDAIYLAAVNGSAQGEPDGQRARCKACGFVMVTIRGRYVGEPSRSLCPQCYVERAEDAERSASVQCAAILARAEGGSNP